MIMTTQDYINRHEFLRPIVEAQSIVDDLVGKLNIRIEFPSIEECKALTVDGVPVLQHEEILDRLIPFEGETDRKIFKAIIRQEFQGRARFMLCDGCRTMWEYNRLGCVYCGNDDLKSIHILEIEAEPDIF